MELDLKIRRNKLHTLSKELQGLYWKPENGERIYKVFQKFNLAEEKYKLYATAVGDIILGFYPKEQLGNLLEKDAQIPKETADKISAELQEFLSPVPEKPTVPKANIDVREKLELRPEGAGKSTLGEKGPEEADAPKPLTREDVLNALAAHRTMASDIKSVKETTDE